MAETVELSVWEPTFIVPEEPIPGAPQGVGIGPVNCENPACKTGCHDVAVLMVGDNSMLSFRFTTEAGRQIAERLIAVCDEQDARTAKRAGKLN